MPPPHIHPAPGQRPITVRQFVSPLEWNELYQRVRSEGRSSTVQPWYIGALRESVYAPPISPIQHSCHHPERPIPPPPHLPCHHWHWREVMRRRYERRAYTPHNMLYFRRSQKTGMPKRKVASLRPIRIR